MEDLEEGMDTPPRVPGKTLPALALLVGLALGGGGGWLASGILGPEGMASGAEEGPRDPAWELYQVDNLILNPAGTQGRRFLILSMAIEVDPDRTLSILERSEAPLRDGILRALGSWGVEDLVDASRRTEVEEVVRAVAREVTGGQPVGRVYFSQFVLQ